MSEPKTRRIKIIHDGDLAGYKARVVDAETGEAIRYVSRVEIVIDAVEGVSAILHVWGPEIEVEAAAEIVEHNHVRGAPFNPFIPVGGFPGGIWEDNVE